MCKHRDESCVQLLCEKCTTWYDCRHCHDMLISDHEFNVRECSTMKCKICHFIGPLSSKCTKCNTGSTYSCVSCRYFSSKENISHCVKCNICDDNGTHVCINLNEDCSICMEPLQDRMTCLITSCKHVFHRKCIRYMFKLNGSTCPLCRKNLRVVTLCDYCDVDITSKNDVATLIRLPCGNKYHPCCRLLMGNRCKKCNRFV